MVYDARGNVIRTVDRDGTVSETVYDELGRAIYGTAPHLPGVAGGAGRRIVYDALGRVIEKQKLEDVEIEIVADTEHPGLFKSHLVGTPTVAGVGSRVYDEAGRMLESREPDGMLTLYEYDVLGRQAAIVVDAEGFAYRTEYTYDALGRVQTVEDADGKVTTYQYDALGRNLRTIFHDGTSVSYEYDALGRLIAETDQLGQTTGYQYDDAGRRTHVIMPEVEHPENPGQMVHPTIVYTYDTWGNVLSITDQNEHVTAFRYDPTGQFVSRQTPLGFAETREYDANGILQAREDADGRRVEYDYDELGRVEVENWFLPGQGTPSETITYVYDDEGRIDEASNNRGTVDYGYDDLGRLISVASPDGLIHYEWDNVRDLLTRMYSGDAEDPSYDVSYDYDALRRLSEVHVTRQAGQTVDQTTTYEYNASNLVSDVNLPNGVVGEYLYDDMDRLESVTYTFESTTLSSVAYVLDDLGRVLHKDSFDGTTTTSVEYVYDVLGRLADEDIGSGQHVICYTYDLVGNRLTKDDSSGGLTEYEYDADDRLTEEVTGNQTTQYEYNDAGATTVKITLTSGVETGRVTYTYDARSQMTGVDLDNDQTDDVTYTYDAGGTLVARTQTGTTVHYLVDTANPTGYSQVLEEWTGIDPLNPGAVVASYVFGTGLISQTRSGTASYCLRDGQGSVVALTSGGAGVTDRYTYDAYGAVLASQGTTLSVHRFNGERFDSELGQYELRARRYDPSNGRFSTADPLRSGTTTALAPYAYASGDPINSGDPSGLMDFNIWSLLTGVGILSTLVGIAMPAYRVGAQTKQLLDISEFVTSIREGLNAGWLPFEDYVSMHMTAQSMAIQIASTLVGNLFELGKAVLETTSVGQVMSWVEIGGGVANMAWSVVTETNGDVHGAIEQGDATFWTKTWQVLHGTQRGIAAGHHLIPQSALQQFGRLWRARRRLADVPANILAMSGDLHERLHGLMREAVINGRRIYPDVGEHMSAILRQYHGNASAYIQDLRVFYTQMDQLPEYRGILHFFENAATVISPQHLVMP